MSRRFLEGDGRRARLGIVVPSVNTVMEPWAHRVLPDGVSLFAAVTIACAAVVDGVRWSRLISARSRAS